MLSDVKNVVSTLFTSKHAQVKPTDPSSPANVEKPAEAPVASPLSNTEEENRAAHIGVPIRGISSRGSGQGVIYASADGKISMHTSPTAETAPLVTPPSSPSKRLSRLWSRRKSTDQNVPKAPEPRPSEPATEAPVAAPVESEPQPVSSSPTAKHTRVPLKNKVMGEFKILSGKVSRDGAKVEQGLALKTGHGHPVEPEERH